MASIQAKRRPSDFANARYQTDAIGPIAKRGRVGEPVPGIRQPSEPDPIIGPSAGDPVGEPIPEPREPKPAQPPIIGPSAGDPVMPGISSADLDGDMPDEPSRPMPAIDPKDLDGDMPADPDTPDMGKDVFGRDKAKLAQKDRDFMKYMQRIMNSATIQISLEEEPK